MPGMPNGDATLYELAAMRSGEARLEALRVALAPEPRRHHHEGREERP